MTETMPIEFSVGGPISKLYFQQNGNKSRIRGIEIRYRDGRVGQIAIDRYLANVGQDAPVPGSRTLTLDIPNRGFVDSIVVTASNARQSSFTVFAR